MRLAGKLTFDIILLLVLGTFIVMALGYNHQARLVPLVLAYPGFAMMLAQFYLDLRGGRGKGNIASGPKAEETAQEGRREASIIGWLIGAVLMLYLVGFVVGLPLFTFLYMKIRERLSWALAIGVSLSLLLIIRFGFVQLLQQDFYQGLLGLFV